MANKRNLREVETNIEEMNEQIRSHRKSVLRRIICVVGIMLVIFVAAELWLALRTFSSYNITSTTSRQDSDAVDFATFGSNIVRYSNDGAVCMNGRDELIWNQAYEMNSPCLYICEDYLTVYDKGGTDIYIMSKEKTVNHLEMKHPIVAVCVARQGTVAVLMKEDTVASVQLYDRSKTELASGEFYQENGGFPVDIALSYDGKIMALSMVDVSDGNLKSTITFYNFGSVGRSEINNNVGTFTYSDMLIPEIEYVSDDRMVAIGDNEILVFSGAEKPTVSAELMYDSTPKSVFYKGNYIGIVTENSGDLPINHVELYNLQAKKVMSINSDLEYRDVYLLQNNEVCLLNDTQCEIYTKHSIKKFAYDFERNIYRILSQGSGAEYIFVFEDETQEVKLR